jgi:hypothetical protein
VATYCFRRTNRTERESQGSQRAIGGRQMGTLVQDDRTLEQQQNTIIRKVSVHVCFPTFTIKSCVLLFVVFGCITTKFEVNRNTVL